MTWGRRREAGFGHFAEMIFHLELEGLQHRDLCPDAVEPLDAVHPAILDRPLSLQLESKFDEEPGCGREVASDIDH